MKVVFMGTPDFAVPALSEICKKHEVVCVYTKAPVESGRGQKITKSPVHIFAEERGIEVRTPKSLKSAEEQELFKSLDADISVVAAYGLILPKAVIEAFPKGCVNIHGSLLPRWRGAAPIQRAIEVGDDKSGITIMQVVEALDAGDMYLKGEVPITSETTGEILHDKMAEVGAKLICDYLDDVDGIKGIPQDEALVTYAAKLIRRKVNWILIRMPLFWNAKSERLIRFPEPILNMRGNVLRYCCPGLRMLAVKREKFLRALKN